jgi:F-type H+-transporting ATPase subunit gamma
MAIQTRAIKRRIKSVKNTRKITKAMELVAASKMRKAVNAVLGSRPFAKLAWETVGRVGKVTDTSLHPLLKRREPTKRVLMLLITSDRGLAGGFNSNMVRRAFQEIRALGDSVEISTICVGKRGTDAMRRAGKPILAAFTDMGNNPSFEQARPIGSMVIDAFVKEECDRVILAYTDFVSALTQKPVLLELLPLGSVESMEELGDTTESSQAPEYLFEPSPKAVLDRVLPRLAETMVYQAILESAASEHSARMMSMRSASDAAGEMIDDLTFTFNQARQAGITQEIAEISSGKAALENM